METFLKDILSKGSVLLTSPLSPSSEEKLYKAVCRASKNEGVHGTIWVCYQHAPFDVEKKLNSYGIAPENLFFIDMISRVMGLKERENIIYCTSPTDYGCLSRSIDEKLDACGSLLVVIDSLNAMMSYDQYDRFIKMLRSLNNRIPQRNSSILYIAISGAFDRQTEVAIKTTMDYVLQIEGGIKGKREIEWENLKNTSWHDVFSLNSPFLFAMIATMFAVIIFLSSILIYLILKLEV